jgi:penicillin-binding protein 1B
MAIAVSRLGGHKGAVGTKRRIRSFGKPVNLVGSLKLAARRGFPYFIALLSLSVIVLGFGFAYFYNYYASMVDSRIGSGFWHSRSGLYAAPARLAVGQRAMKHSVMDRLRRAGFVDGRNPEPIWNGGFVAEGDRIEIFPNPALVSESQPVEIVFAGNKVKSIKQGGTEAEAYSIEPELLTGRTETKRAETPVLTYAQIPENLRNAIIAAEDQRFFSHFGIDLYGVARAFWTNLRHGDVKQGGSTITQQLVKNTFLSPEKSFQRKFAEAFLAVALERRMSKEQIFALYCNEIYLGQYGSSGVHGVEQAARAYFGKELDQISLAEAAAIAAMIKNPNRFAPNKNAEEARIRREQILEKLGEYGFALAGDVEVALNSTLELAPPKLKGNAVAPYFVDAATKELDSRFDGDYLNTNFNIRVYTTIDTYLQNLAENAIANGLSKLRKTHTKTGQKIQASLVALDPQNGHILALVGGRDYSESQFNRATDAYRQPGSTFKPFVYATALEHGYTPISLFSDRPMEFKTRNSPVYQPANYGGSYSMTNITLKTALTKSSNVVAVETAVDVGLVNVADKAREFGFEKVEPYPSMALGTMETTPLQLATAYAVFANGGKRVEPTFIDRVLSGDDGVLYMAAPGSEQVINEKTAYMITDMLEAVVDHGTARAAHGALGKDVIFAGKTGSSKDGWFVGYTPNLVTVVWVGIDGNEDIRSTGGETALPIWTDFMKAVVQTRPEYGGDAFPMPRGLTAVVVDPATGMLADTYCPMSEKVVLPTSAVSNIKCLLHQPRVAPVVTADLDSTISPDTIITYPTSDLGNEPKTNIERPYYEEYEETERTLPEPAPKQKPKGHDRPINDSYFLEYERMIKRKADG